MMVVTFSVPVVFFSGRNYAMSLITNYGIKKFKDNTPTWFFVTFSYAMYFVILCLGLFISNISTILSFVGAICSNSICYIFPAAIYLGIGKKGTLFYYGIILLLIFGCTAGIVSVVGTAITLGK